MSIRFRPDPGLADELGGDPAFRRWVLARAIDVRKEIPSRLPVGRSGGRRVQAFARKSFAEVEGTGRDVHAVVGTKWRLGHIIEFGSVNNPAYAPVRKSVLALGMRFEEGGR
jgi:hypothetical protein